MAGEGYLPPVVIEVVGDSTRLKSDLADDEAVLKAFGDKVTKAPIETDSGQFYTGINAVKAQLLQLGRDVTDAKIGADSVLFWSDIFALRAEVEGMSPVDINVDANIGAALSKIAALRGALSMAQLGQMGDAYGPTLPGGGGGGGGRGGLLGLLGLFGDKGGAGPASALGWGSGMFGMAGWGTLAGMAGFGFEHAATTGLGLAGSAVGAGIGGGILGAGALGVGAVGLGTDLAGIGQASGDIKMVTSDMNALNLAIAKYGAGSLQAQAAQNQLNYDLQGFSPIAKQAVVWAAYIGQGFKTQFDSATGAAEKTGAEIISQAMLVGEKFLPTIGKFASQNMGIIQKSLQPLFAWLQGPGLAIFTELEQVFQAHLPTAMHAFTMGVELVLRTLGLVAPMTGGLLTTIDKFLTKMNTSGWGKWSSDIRSLVGLFRIWDAFIKILVLDIAGIFKASAGLGKGIIQDLTGMLTRLHEWITSSRGQGQLQTLFAAHKNQIIQLLNVLPSLVGSFGQLYLILSPALTQAVALLVGALNTLLHLPLIGPILAWGLAFYVLGSRLKIVSNIENLVKGVGKLLDIARGVPGVLEKAGVAISKAGAIAGRVWTVFSSGAATVGSAIANVARSFVTASANVIKSIIGWIAMGVGWIAENVAMAASAVAAFIAENAATLGIIAAIALLVAAIVFLATHWRQVWADVKAIVSEAWHFIYDGIGKYLLPLLGPVGLVALGAIELAKHWQLVWGIIKSIVSEAWAFLSPIFHFIVSVGLAVIQTGISVLQGAWNIAWSAIQTVVSTVWGVLQPIFTTVSNVVGTVITGAINTLQTAWNTAWSAVSSALQTAWGIIQPILNAIQSAVGTVSGAVGALGGALGGLEHAGGALLGAIGIHLAGGGIVSRPTIALVGEAGPEAVIPLGMLNDKSGVAPLPSGFGNRAGGGALTLTVNATFEIHAPGGNPNAIKTAIEHDSAEHFAKQALVSLRAGAGTTYG